MNSELRLLNFLFFFLWLKTIKGRITLCDTCIFCYIHISVSTNRVFCSTATLIYLHISSVFALQQQNRIVERDWIVTKLLSLQKFADLCSNSYHSCTTWWYAAKRSQQTLFQHFVWKLFLSTSISLLGTYLSVCVSVSDQIRSLSRVRLFATPWIAVRQASLSITNSQSSLRLTSIESVMPSSHLILCRPLLLLPPIPPSIRVVLSNILLVYNMRLCFSSLK